MTEVKKITKQFLISRLTISAGVLIIAISIADIARAAQCGRASWYALDGRRTASGEIMNSRRMTAAHRTLRFGTRVRVRNRRNGRSVVVRINDRGPYTRGRIIDVSRHAAEHLNFMQAGTARVRVEVQ